jgi:hypothetical protein
MHPELERSLQSNNTYRFFGGCNTTNCNMTINVNSTSNSSWKAEIYRKTAACTTEFVKSIGGPGSGANQIILTGQSGFVDIDGFKDVTIKQITGNVNYTLSAPSATWSPISPSTFSVNAGATTSRNVGCAN